MSLGIITLLSSCGMMNDYAMSAPAAPLYVSTAPSASERTLNRNSISTKQRVVVKKGSMKLDAENVRDASESIEQITLKQGGHMLSYNERDDTYKSASFSIRVPAQNLVSTMDEIATMGKVTYRRVTVEDQTQAAIAQKARLAKLKQRKARLEAMYRSATDIEDKLELESSLAEIEEEIFSMEEGIRQMQRIANFSKLDLSLSQKTIRGPVGVLVDGTKWTWGKLFTIRK